MGLTERHWFEDEEPELTERQLEDNISIQDGVYRRGYHKGYLDGVKEQKEKTEHLNNITLEYEKEVFRLQTLLKEQEERIKLLEHQLETITKWRMNKWMWTSFDRITCMNCGFTHSDEAFMLNDDADGMQNGYPYCPKCGIIMNGFQPDGHWLKKEDMDGERKRCDK